MGTVGLGSVAFSDDIAVGPAGDRARALDKFKFRQRPPLTSKFFAPLPRFAMAQGDGKRRSSLEDDIPSREGWARRLRQRFSPPEMLNEDGSLNIEYVPLAGAQVPILIVLCGQIFPAKGPKGIEGQEMVGQRAQLAHRWYRALFADLRCTLTGQ